MKCGCRLQIYKLVAAVLVTLTILTTMYSTFQKGIMLKAVEEHFVEQNLGVIADRWILVDGTNLSNDDLLRIDDVPEWRILVFGGHITFSSRRCTNCLFTRDIFTRNTSAPTNLITRKPSSATHVKMESFVHTIRHGAKWIYVTDQIVNLAQQVEGFHFDEAVKGLMYQGQAVFDSDQHFGAKAVPEDATSRQKYNSYLLGEYVTPSVQSKWKPPRHVWEKEHAKKDNNACRLPHAIVPARLIPPMTLMGSLIGYRSFWVLGSLVTECKSPSLAYWWLQLMNDLQETIGIYPRPCENVSTFQDTKELSPRSPQVPGNTTQCRQSDSFFTCGVLHAQAMASCGILGHTDVVLLMSWFDTLVSLHFREPLRQTSKKQHKKAGLGHRVVFEHGDVRNSVNKTINNPFQGICKSKSPIKNATQKSQHLIDVAKPDSKYIIPNTTPTAPINDILLVVIFNHPTLYSNILYLDYIYRKYFTNILYCGALLDKFSIFQKNYRRPINFLEVNEISNGIFGYLCSAYAMDMGFKVSGYLQMSDDVLLNMWTIADLPRDKMWFQHSIRNGSIIDPSVPNITPIMADKHWWPWSSQWGVGRLRETFADFELLKKTSEQSRVVSFFKQLKTNLGGRSGGFYEASDIFYVPTIYTNNFNFFSKLCGKHHLYLEIAIPTMLCGFDNITSIRRLNGTYLWYGERPGYAKVFNPENHFLHPWKVKPQITQAEGKDFFCTKYLRHIM